MIQTVETTPAIPSMIARKVETKKCSCCGEWKPLSEFHKNKSAKDGYQWRCKTCMEIARKKSKAKKRESNPEAFERANPNANPIADNEVSFLMKKRTYQIIVAKKMTGIFQKCGMKHFEAQVFNDNLFLVFSKDGKENITFREHSGHADAKITGAANTKVIADYFNMGRENYRLTLSPNRSKRDDVITYCVQKCRITETNKEIQPVCDVDLSAVVQENQPVEMDEQMAINLLKSKGYRIMRPETKWVDV